MTNSATKYDLEERTLKFAMLTRKFVRGLKLDLVNNEDAKQLIRASGSVGANYIEANEALGKKDLLMRMRISRKESKEARYWLNLVQTSNEQEEKIRLKLIQESTELLRIFSSMISKLE
ncbi:MAG: four helix bundle protein [Saprospiraceae bacterium]|nr:four helix bundle protein [Saprospiraceae bacterium]